jgi:hypothetical protein
MQPHPAPFHEGEDFEGSLGCRKTVLPGFQAAVQAFQPGHESKLEGAFYQPLALEAFGDGHKRLSRFDGKGLLLAEGGRRSAAESLEVKKGAGDDRQKNDYGACGDCQTYFFHKRSSGEPEHSLPYTDINLGSARCQKKSSVILDIAVLPRIVSRASD